MSLGRQDIWVGLGDGAFKELCFAVEARKVFQALGSEAGGRHTVRLFSVIRTAVINGLDPCRYLEYALENVGKKPIGAILRTRRTLNPLISTKAGFDRQAQNGPFYGRVLISDVYELVNLETTQNKQK